MAKAIAHMAKKLHTRTFRFRTAYHPSLGSDVTKNSIAKRIIRVLQTNLVEAAEIEMGTIRQI